MNDRERETIAFYVGFLVTKKDKPVNLSYRQLHVLPIYLVIACLTQEIHNPLEYL